MSGAFFYEHIVDYFITVQDANNNESQSKNDSVKKPKKK